MKLKTIPLKRVKMNNFINQIKLIIKKITSNKLFDQIVILSESIEKQTKVFDSFADSYLVKSNHRFRRNFLPNDSSLSQKILITMWKSEQKKIIGYKDFLDSEFRVFSQNGEDGILLKIFTHIGSTNKNVLEIGANCSDSDIGVPENMATNLIVNHGWHGIIFEIDKEQCDHMQYFFARDFATKHFHYSIDSNSGFYSPLILPQEINPININDIADYLSDNKPDLMIIDIDGSDYEIVKNMESLQPRVLVVEFEKRFRDRYSVVQFDRKNFSKKWPQSGAASLLAWENLMASKGYTLIAIGTCGFNAFFVRSDIATDKFSPLNSRDAFNSHPILSQVSEDLWILPDESWKGV
jgi:hypothetical protein